MSEVKLNNEQKEIVELIEILSKTSSTAKKGKRFSWNKFNGNVACNVIKEYLNKRLKKGLKAVGPAFITGHPNEFDILVVDEFAQPEKYTDAYEHKHVHAVIELKSHGTMSEKALIKIKETFDDLMKQYPIKCLYIAIRESGHPKEKGSKNWVAITKNILTPHEVYVLCDSRTKELYYGEWEKILELINSL